MFDIFPNNILIIGWLINIHTVKNENKTSLYNSLNWNGESGRVFSGEEACIRKLNINKK